MNKAILMGRLTSDPEIRYTEQNNTAVTNFTLAVDRKFQKDKTDFIPIVTWRQTAEFAGKYFTKGMRVAVVGSIQTRSYEGKNGKVYVTEVVADEVYFADSKREQREESDAEEPPIMDDGGDEELPF